MKLSETQRVILSAAAQHEMGIARAPKTLPAAARNAVFRSLIKNNLLTEINAPREHVGLGWRQDEDGTWIVARITDEGLRAIGIDPNAGDAREEDERSAKAIARRNAERRAAQEAGEPIPPYDSEEERAMQRAAILEAEIAAEEAAAPRADTAPTGGEAAVPEETPTGTNEPAHTAPTPPEGGSLAEDLALLDEALATPLPEPRPSLRAAARRVLDAWDDAENHRYDLADAMEALRAALAARPPRAAREGDAPRKPREGTKQEQVLALLRREEGATIAQICEATGWQQHTVRGFFAGLKRRQGITVIAAERIRQVGPNREGARGSYTIYRIAE